MNGNIVNCAADSRHILTVETREGGVLSAVPANLDGSPVQNDGVTYASQTHPKHTEVYLDTISGNHFAKVMPSQLKQLEEDGVQVYQGVGGVHGWFVEAPDFTLSGRHGGKPAKRRPAAVEPDFHGGGEPADAAHEGKPAPVAHLQNGHAKKRAKKAK
jgi:hypothetical protein